MFLIPFHSKRKPTWRSRVRWLAKLAWYDVTWKSSILVQHIGNRPATNVEPIVGITLAQYWFKTNCLLKNSRVRKQPNDIQIHWNHSIRIVLNQTHYFNNFIPYYTILQIKICFMQILFHAIANEQIMWIQYCKPLLNQRNFNIGLTLGQDCNVVWVYQWNHVNTQSSYNLRFCTSAPRNTFIVIRNFSDVKTMLLKVVNMNISCSWRYPWTYHIVPISDNVITKFNNSIIFIRTSDSTGVEPIIFFSCSWINFLLKNVIVIEYNVNIYDFDLSNNFIMIMLSDFNSCYFVNKPLKYLSLSNCL